eukprot:m.68009 g.68009  ORF g.68009 m.68009 type:complete len:100 (+) comp8233_c0_seq14:958-1257(+)
MHPKLDMIEDILAEKLAEALDEPNHQCMPKPHEVAVIHTDVYNAPWKEEEEKFKSKSWIYGKTPAFEYSETRLFENLDLTIVCHTHCHEHLSSTTCNPV